MLVHKLIRTVAAVLALSLAIIATIVIVKRIFPTYPLGVKGDRLEISAQDCSQAGWPYGCDWQPQSATPEPKKRLLFGRRGKRLRCRGFGNC
jgi:hypothetical protein